MYAGAAKAEITPEGPVWMDGMLRAHPSEGVHDPLYVKALVLGEGPERADAVAFVSVDVCALDTAETDPARQAAAAAAGIPAERIIIHATHTHSGPASHGFFNPREDQFVADMTAAIAEAVKTAAEGMRPARVGAGSGEELTISHYRRLMATDGHVVMNWEPWPEDQLVGPLGEVDPEVGVLQVVGGDGATIGTLFNFACHPNVMSGDNYLLSSEYPGDAEARIAAELGGVALFFNGAQGTMDIDGLRDRDWDGLERCGKALAQAVVQTAARTSPAERLSLRLAVERYTIPARKLTDEEYTWAQAILKETGGEVQFLADGVGDDYVAVLYDRLRSIQDQPIALEQTVVAVGDTALLTFPGELYTEIGQAIKDASPFPRTWILGLSNGHIGYVPTAKAIEEGGYAEDTRGVDETAETAIIEHSLALLGKVHAQIALPQE